MGKKKTEDFPGAAYGFTHPVSSVLRAGRGFSLQDADPGAKPGFPGSKSDGRKALAAADGRLDELQERLYAQARGGDDPTRVLLVLQAMDTAGKGGIVRHVIGSVDPQGVQLHAFKAPTPAEKRHDFLWRIERRLPGAGMIGVFDRSHYEDVLIGSVRSLARPEEIERRLEAIRGFEQRLADEGTHIIKVMLNISPEEQYQRLAERLDRADKHWKFNPGDIDERELWDDYMQAYQRAIRATDADHAPWYVVPANRKWYARLAVQHLLLETLAGIDPQWPAADFDVEAQRERLKKARDIG
ncbi:PPK2 family polyphosphate kinase [Arthrobacter sp.]|uniref:PPK2 family polyphosphate kinase n=1 Tax=Arthrobacter sp. TaxID=1667 RepID=UPI003A8E6BB4